MAKMKRLLLIFLSVWCLVFPTQAQEVKHHLKTSIGFFDACEVMFDYAFYKGKDYDVKTSVQTSGMFGTLYPFTATYHAVGIYKGADFLPQDYYYETQNRSKRRTKEIVYENGVPQYRVSTKGTKKRTDKIVTNPAYGYSGDLLSVFGALAHKINQTGKCDFEQYSFNGKRYAKSTVETVKKERIKTDYFQGRAIKCRYMQEILEDTDAGFLLKPDVPIYFWVLKDDKTDAYFLARILIEDTPFGELEAITTKIEVKP